MHIDKGCILLLQFYRIYLFILLKIDFMLYVLMTFPYDLGQWFVWHYDLSHNAVIHEPIYLWIRFWLFWQKQGNVLKPVQVRTLGDNILPLSYVFYKKIWLLLVWIVKKLGTRVLGHYIVIYWYWRIRFEKRTIYEHQLLSKKYIEHQLQVCLYLLNHLSGYSL